jgi:hypothetical protein
MVLDDRTNTRRDTMVTAIEVSSDDDATTVGSGGPQS